MPHTAFIGVGSNQNDPLKQCRTAVTAIDSHPDLTLLHQSHLYKSEPFGQPDQEWFVNLVIQVETGLLPDQLLEVLLKIEQDMGRERREKWGPRTIDLDILLYDTIVMDKEGLTIPHPGIAERRFVLEPLNDLAPELGHPLLNKSIEILLSELQDDLKVERLDSSL